MSRRRSIADDPAPDDLPANIRAVGENYSAATAARLTVLAEALPPGQAWQLLDLVTALDNAVSRHAFDDAEDTWPRVLAHVPGPAPALTVVYDHVLHVISPCAVCAPEGESQ